MGYSPRKFDRRRQERPWIVHPVWRGIGCFLFILIPIMAWAGAELFLQTNQTIKLPPELYRQVNIPLTNWGFVNVVLIAIDTFLSKLRLTYGVILFTLGFIVIGYGLISIIYGIAYKMFGPPRYSDLDAPPNSVPKRKR